MTHATHKAVDTETGRTICTLPIPPGGGRMPTYRTKIVPLNVHQCVDSPEENDPHWNTITSMNDPDAKSELAEMLQNYWSMEEALCDLYDELSKLRPGPQNVALHKFYSAKKEQLLADLSPAAREILAVKRCVSIPQAVFEYEAGPDGNTDLDQLYARECFLVEK